MKRRYNLRGIGSLVVITICFVSVMGPPLTRSALPLFSDANNATEDELPEPTLALTPTPSTSPAAATPGITSFAPDYPVSDIEGANRTFSITTDQAVNISWLLNGTEVLNQTNVTRSIYTNTGAIGRWNITALASNENGADMQKWIWTVSQQHQETPVSPLTTPVPTPTPAPIRVLSSGVRPSPSLYIYGRVSYEDGAPCEAPFVVITNLDTNEKLIADNHTGISFYQRVTNSTFVHACSVLQIEASTNGTFVGNATHTVTPEDLYRGVIAVDINKGMPDLVIPDSGIAIPPLLVNKTNTIHVTVWNNGYTASEAFNVSFSVSRGKEPEYEDKTRVSGLDHGTYATISFSWIPPLDDRYNLTFYADSNHELKESNEMNNELTTTVFVGVPDFSVTAITLNPDEPELGDEVQVNATIANIGVKNGSTTVEFYDTKSIELKRTEDEYSRGESITDVFTLPGALNIRAHFSHIRAYSSITIYEKNNPIPIMTFDFPTDDITDYWMEEWASGDTIRIESQGAEFAVDRYEALLAKNESIRLSRGNATTIAANWNLSRQEMGWATSGEHNITVIVDPHDRTVESSETNNTKTRTVMVNASLDFTVTNISFSTIEPELYETVELHAAVANYGVRNGTATLRAYCDETSVNETVLSLNCTEPLKIVDLHWAANIPNGGAGHHNISVVIDPDNVFFELNETNNALPSQRIYVNGTDLAVVKLEIPCGQFGGPRCYRGKKESIKATIANHGALDASNVTVMLRDGRGAGNTSGSNATFLPSTLFIPLVKRGANTSINVTWTPAAFGRHTIAVRVPSDKADNNDTNNERFVHVSVKPECDFSVEQVCVYPEKVKEGGNVTINATIANLGLKNGSVNVSFYVNNTDCVGTKNDTYREIKRTKEPVYVERDSTNSTSITWRANVTGGDYFIFAVLDPDNEVPEWPDDFTKIAESIILKDPDRAGNNVNSCLLHVNISQLSITNLSLYPQEPVIETEVNVTAVIENKGNETANSTVWFYVEKPLEPPVHHTKMTGSEVWNCLIVQPENLPIRAHLPSIDIKIKVRDPRITAYVDDKPVNLYVKSEDVAEGQPIKLSEINFDSPCGDCQNYSAKGNCIERRWKNVWTEWRAGKTIKVKTSVGSGENEAFALSIDSYQVQLGNRTITIDANSSSSYDVTWNASLPLKAQEFKEGKPVDEGNILVGENYTLIANVEDEVVRKETYLSGTDLAVDFSLNETYYDGDEEKITAVITNFGLKNATAFMVNCSKIYDYGTIDAERTLINSTTIECLEAGNTTNSSVPWKARMRNIKAGGEDVYTIQVELEPLENSKFEERHDDDCVQTVRVKRSRDFSVTNLSFVTHNETQDASQGTVSLTPGENVTVNATLTITNLANGDGTANVRFYVDDVDREHEIGNASAEFGNGNDTGYAEIVWHVWDFGDVKIAGDHDITVVVDPQNETYELNESNNASTWQLHVYAPELVVTGLHFEPDKATINESECVNISLGVANSGDEHATNVSLVVYECADRHVESTEICVYGSSVYPGLSKRVIKRDNATAMKFYMDLDIDDGFVCIRNRSGTQICYDENYHGWTPWIFDRNVSIEAIRGSNNGSAFAAVSKVYYLEPSKRLFPPGNSSFLFTLNETEERTIPILDNWTAAAVGEHFIVATIDTENENQEYNELNNTFWRYITVQTADLAVNDIQLTWLDGTPIGRDAIVRDNDTVRIIAAITNSGVAEVANFDVRILGGGEELLNETKCMTVMPGDVITVPVNWTAKVGTQVIKVEAAYDEEETNETNNIAARELYVHGAEVRGNTTWESLGLHGAILFDPAQPYDEDSVNITAVIHHSGRMNATNFSAALLFDYTPSHIYSKKANTQPGHRSWINKSYSNAVGLCLYISDITSGSEVLAIYDGNDTEITRTDGSCGVLVPGDTANIKACTDNWGPTYTISFYPVYESNLTAKRTITLNVNSSINVSTTVRNVTAGNHLVMLFIDPEGNVPEDDKGDNIVLREMDVLPTRDFTILRVTPERENSSDASTITITANVSNPGYRNGTAKVRFFDYENECRVHRYYLNNSLPDCSPLSNTLSYLPVSPDATVPPGKNLTIIHRPGVDAITLHFEYILLHSGLTIPYPGELHVFNGTGAEVLSVELPDKISVFNGTGMENHKVSADGWLPIVNKNVCPGDTAYIYTTYADFHLNGYTTMKSFNETNVTLNASVAWDASGNITEVWSESKNITMLWNASTGTHNISVTIDPDDEIIEMNETNNTYVRLLSVNATKELELVALNSTPRHPTSGDNVTITAKVRNNGTERANFTADLWMDALTDASSASLLHDWSIAEGEKTRYITLLNHTELSLAPGEVREVNGTWYDLSVYGNPMYIVRAIVDPRDEIDEMNERNNEMSTEITMRYPDLTIVSFNAPAPGINGTVKNASVTIENRGAVNVSMMNASEITVSLELLKHNYNPETTDMLNITNASLPPITITKEGANEIRIHFASLSFTTGGYLRLCGIKRDGERYIVKEYDEDAQNVWTPWVSGDTIIIEDHLNANFYIDGYECKNVYKAEEGASELRICFDSLDTTGANAHIDIYGTSDGEPYRAKTYSDEEWGYTCTPWVNGDTITLDYANAYYSICELKWKVEDITKRKPLNVSERDNISISGSRYDGLTVLNVSIDPYNTIIEQKENNNNGTVLIYVDLMPEGIAYVYNDDELSGVNVTLLNNDNAVEEAEGDGIAFPANNFTIALKFTKGDETVCAKRIRIHENQTIYGGETITVPFTVNESMLLPNKTYELVVVVDSENEVEEKIENNNVLPAFAGPDIRVGEIYTKLASAESCECNPGAVITNEGNLRATDFDVRVILNSTSKNVTSWDERIPSLDPNETMNWTFRKYHDGIIEPNEIYNVTVIADPDDRVEELNEWNNENEPNPETIGPDLRPRYMIFNFTKNENKVKLDKLVRGENLTANVMVENAGKVSAANFSVAINVSNVSVASTNVSCLPGGEERAVPLLKWTPWNRGFHYVSATVDIPDKITETNDNNNALVPTLVKVGEPNYKATKPLNVFPPMTVDGGVYYDASGPYSGALNGSRSYSTTFENRIPNGATSVYARLYLYMWGWKDDPNHPDPYKLGKLPQINDVKFIVNGHLYLVSAPLTYEEFPDASQDNWTYATCAYNIPDSILRTIDANDGLGAKVTFNGTGVDQYAVSGMGLFVAYQDSKGLLTRYYIGEGGDIIMAKNNELSTGFEYDKCTSNVEFCDVEDSQLANATLITVLAPYKPLEPCEGTVENDCLIFNEEPVGEPIENDDYSSSSSSSIVHYWSHYTTGNIALTANGERGEYVDARGSNIAKIQSRGSYFFLTNAILKVTYPPELAPSVDTSLSATVGQEYDIPITITNRGKSKAKEFNVSIAVDGEHVKNEKITLNITGITGIGNEGSSKTIKITERAPATEGIIRFNVTVNVDPENKVAELINLHHRNGERNNIIEEEVTVVVKPGGWDLRPGGGGGTGEEWGEGTETGEGGAAGGGGGTTGETEGAVGETGGETITGRLMKGIGLSSEAEGGGGKGEFSLIGFLLWLTMLASAFLLVYAGYLMERRRQRPE